MEKKNNRSFLKIIIFILLIAVALVVISTVFVSAYSQTLDYGFDEELFNGAKSGNITKIFYDANSASDTLGEYEPVLFEEIFGGSTKKLWCSYDNISDSVKNAFISMEDRSFFEHRGVDVKRTIGAYLNYFLHFKSKFGGSTITQQLIKNISGDNEQSFKRKFNEILRAINIEKTHNKEEIFEAYLNIVSMSENIIGVAEASEIYFGKSVATLNYPEAAVLVGIANAPAKYNPYKYPEACLEKRNKVLYSLYQCSYITEDEYRDYKELDLGVIERKGDNSTINSWFAETVLNELAQDLSNSKNISLSAAIKYVYTGGLSIYSTVSPSLQNILEEYFENEDNFQNCIKEGLQYSMVISSPGNGNLLGIVGGVGEKTGNLLLNYAQTNITPGSTLKPLALYAPLLNEKKINWATVFDDVPVEFKETLSGTYTPFPKNAPEIYDGLTTVKDALRFSKNTVAVRLYNMLGAEKIYKSLKDDFGFDTIVRELKSGDGRVFSDLAPSPLALGQLTQGITLRKLTESYNVFSNDGVLAEGRSYIAAFDNEGKLIMEKPLTSKRVFSFECARIMNKLLENVVDSGTAKKITLPEIMDTAGKTGTSGDDHDRLFIGYTPYFTAGIWCGHTGTKKAIGAQSLSHLDIWDDVMHKVAELYENEEERYFSQSGLEYLPYCKDSGLGFSENCLYDVRGDRLEYGYFSHDNRPIGLCKTHIMYKYDKLTGGIAHEGCDEEYLEDVALIKLENRSFPIQIIITDAEFVCRDIKDGIEYPSSYDVPFFEYALMPDEYVGRSKGKKQFNSFCYLHND